MKHKTFFSLAIAIAMFFSLPCTATFAEEKATPDEVYELILKAVPVIEQLGEAGLEAFKDPKGEFVYKDTYVLVLDCGKMKMAAHPNPKVIGISLDNMDKHPDPSKRKYQSREACEMGSRPTGGWVDYYWPKLGSSEASRKISFNIKVPGTDYVLCSGIYDDTTSVEELNASLN